MGRRAQEDQKQKEGREGKTGGAGYVDSMVSRGEGGEHRVPFEHVVCGGSCPRRIAVRPSAERGPCRRRLRPGQPASDRVMMAISLGARCEVSNRFADGEDQFGHDAQGQGRHQNLADAGQESVGMQALGGGAAGNTGRPCGSWRRSLWSARVPRRRGRRGCPARIGRGQAGPALLPAGPGHGERRLGPRGKLGELSWAVPRLTAAPRGAAAARLLAEPPGRR